MVVEELIVMITSFSSDHKIMAWLSPAYPTGAYSFSHGLEEAISSKIIHDKEGLYQWLLQILRFGSGRNDAILVSNAFNCEKKNLLDLGRTAEAFAGTRQRHHESLQQGLAFAKITSRVCGINIPKVPLPIAVGHAAKLENIELSRLLPLYIHAFTANLVSAAIRFLPLGQTDGQMILFELFNEFDRLGAETIEMGLDGLANSCFLNDIGIMKHETMVTRIFRS